ncbi:hypothetical protein K435DRAFT_773656, partial [Dendrothele bispora CBS 962.96]
CKCRVSSLKSYLLRSFGRLFSLGNAPAPGDAMGNIRMFKGSQILGTYLLYLMYIGIRLPLTLFSTSSTTIVPYAV